MAIPPIGKSPAAALRAGRGGLGGGRLAPAWGAEVVSSNIVGYNKLTLSNQYNLLGSQFVNVGKDIKDINELFDKNNTLPGLDDEGEFQTTLRIWDGSAYAYYGWLDADDGTNNEVPEWNSSWILNDMTDQASFDVPDGEGFWVIIPKQSSASVTMSGEVIEGDSVTKPVKAGFNLMSNPFPAELDIQKIQSTDLLGLDDEGEFQTTLRIWDGSAYEYYGWLDADDGTNNEVPEWNSHWILYDMTDVASAKIGIGKGFWIVSPNASGNITFTK